MKTKNLLLGLVAFVFAFGSAFAAFVNPPDPTAYVWIKRGSLENDFVCEATSVTCTNTTGNTCTIAVSIDLPTARTENVSAHLNSNCDTSILKNSSATAISFNPSGTDVYDAQN